MNTDTSRHDRPASADRTVAVILPAYDVVDYVAEAVASVAAQSWASIRMIAVDDGSRDGTGARLARLAADWTGPGRRMEVVRQENRGASAARNAGLGRALESEAAFVALLDADDRWQPDLLVRLVATLDGVPCLDMTFPRLRYIDSDGRPIGVESPAGKARYSAADLMIENPVHSATGVVLRAEAASRAGWFDESLSACIDLDYWVRLAALRPDNIGPTDAILGDYRRRAGQITGDWRRMENGWTRVAAKLAEAGRGLSGPAYRAGRGRHCLFWSTVAYNAGDYPAARRLIAEAWHRSPAFVAAHRLGRVRTAACLASLLPGGLHDGIRARFNARRSG